MNVTPDRSTATSVIAVGAVGEGGPERRNGAEVDLALRVDQTTSAGHGHLDVQ